MRSGEKDVSKVPIGNGSRRRAYLIDIGAYFVLPLLILIGIPSFPGAPVALWLLLLSVPFARAISVLGALALAWKRARKNP
jgi:hypothetical protein